MSDSFLPFPRGYARGLLITFCAAAMMGLGSTGCQRRAPEASAPETVETGAKAALEKALAEDKARVVASPVETEEETKKFAEQRAANEKRREETRLREQAEEAREAEIAAADQKVRELDARNLEFGAAAKGELEWRILDEVKERKESSVIVEVTPKSRGSETAWYKVELRAPRFEIWPADLESERANLTTADRLNGKLANLEWRGFAFVEAAAYRVLDKRIEKAGNTVELWAEQRPAFEDGAWHDARANGRLPLPVLGTYRIEKTTEGWSVKKVNGLTKERFLEDWERNRPVRRNGRGDAEIPSSAPKRVAESFLSLQPVQATAAAADPDMVEAAKAEFEKYVIQRTPESLTLRSEERASKIRIRSLNESPYYIERRTTEYHAPVITVEALQLNDAERLNGVEWRGKVSLKADSYRLLEISPEPEKRIQSEDGSWQSSYEAKEFILTRKGPEWSLALVPPRDEYRLLKRE